MDNIDLDAVIAAAASAAEAAEPFVQWDAISFAEAEAAAKDTQEVLMDLLGKAPSREEAASYAAHLSGAVFAYRAAQTRYEEVKALEAAWGSAVFALASAKKKALESLR